MAFSKEDRKVVFEFFENLLLSENKPVYYDNLRGHISKASPVVQNYVRKECKGEKLLEYFQNRKNYFIVDKCDVSLKKKRLKKCYSGASSKSGEVNHFYDDCLRSSNSYEYSDSSSCTRSDSFASSRKSTLDSTDENQLPLYDKEMIEYEKITFQYFSDFLARNVKLSLDEIEFNSLPKKVKRFLSKCMKKNISLFLQNYPDVFHIDDNCIMLATKNSVVEKASSHQETSCVDKEISPVLEKVTSSASAEEKAVENFFHLVDFFVNILKKKCSPVHVDNFSGHISCMPKKVYNYLNRNYKPYKRFFVETPKLFLLNEQEEISLSNDHSKLLKRARKYLSVKLKDKSLSAPIQKVIKSLFELPLPCVQKSDPSDTNETNLSDISTQSSDHLKSEITEESASDVLVTESCDHDIINKPSDNGINVKAERTYTFFKECLHTVQLLCLELVEKEHILSLNYEYKTVKFFTEILENQLSRGCELSYLQGHLGHAPKDIQNFMKQLYKGQEGIKEFFQKNKEFEFDDVGKPIYCLRVMLSENYQTQFEDRIKQQKKCTRTKTYFQSLCNSHWNKISFEFVEGLFMILSFLQNKQKAKLSRLCGNISKLSPCLQSFINSFSGKEQPEKVKKFLGYFSFFTFPSEDHVAISSEVDISLIINTKSIESNMADINYSSNLNKNFEVENPPLDIKTFKANVIQFIKDFLSNTSSIQYSDLPKVLGHEIEKSLEDLKLQSVDLIIIIFESNLFLVEDGEIRIKISGSEFPSENCDVNMCMDNSTTEVSLEKVVLDSSSHKMDNSSTQVQLEKVVLDSSSHEINEKTVENCTGEESFNKKEYQHAKLHLESMNEINKISNNFDEVACNRQVPASSIYSNTTITNGQSDVFKIKSVENIHENDTFDGINESKNSAACARQVLASPKSSNTTVTNDQSDVSKIKSVEIVHENDTFDEINESKNSAACARQVLASPKSSNTTVTNDQSDVSKIISEEIVHKSKIRHLDDRSNEDIPETESQYMLMQNNCAGNVIEVQNEKNHKDILCESSSQIIHENTSCEESTDDENVVELFHHLIQQLGSEESENCGTYPTIQSEDKLSELNTMSNISIGSKETKNKQSVNESFAPDTAVCETERVHLDVYNLNTSGTKSSSIPSVNDTFSSNKIDVCKLACDLENDGKVLFYGMENPDAKHFVSSPEGNLDYAVKNMEMSFSEETDISGKISEGECVRNDMNLDYAVENIEMSFLEETDTSGKISEGECVRNDMDYEKLSNSVSNIQVSKSIVKPDSLLAENNCKIKKSKEMIDNMAENLRQKSVDSNSLIPLSSEKISTAMENSLKISDLPQKMKDDNLSVVDEKIKTQDSPVSITPVSYSKDNKDNLHVNSAIENMALEKNNETKVLNKIGQRVDYESRNGTVGKPVYSDFSSVSVVSKDDLHVNSAEENIASKKDNERKVMNKISQQVDYESRNGTVGKPVHSYFSDVSVVSKETETEENLLYVAERETHDCMIDDQFITSLFNPVSHRVNGEQMDIDANRVPEALNEDSKFSFEYEHVKSSKQKQDGTYSPFFQPLSGKVILLSVDTCIVETTSNGQSEFTYCLKSAFHCDRHTNCVQCFDSLNVGDKVSCYIPPAKDDCKLANMCFSFMFCKDSTSDTEKSSCSQNSDKGLSKRYQSKSQSADPSDGSCGSKSVKKIPSYYSTNPNCSNCKKCQTNPRDEVLSLSSTVDKACETDLSPVSRNIPIVHKSSESSQLCSPVVEKECQVTHPSFSQSTQAACKSSKTRCQTELSGEVGAHPMMVERECQFEYPTFSQETQTVSKSSCSIQCQTQLSGKVQLCSSVAEKESQVLYSTSSKDTQTLNNVKECECQTDISGKIKRVFDNCSASTKCQTTLSGRVRKCADLANKSCQSLFISSLDQTSQTSPIKSFSMPESFTNSFCDMGSMEGSFVGSNAKGGESSSYIPECAKTYCDQASQTISTGPIMIKKCIM